MLALHQAIASRRQHPGNDALLRTAVRRCAETLAVATAAGPLTLTLRVAEVAVEGEPVLPFAAGEPPFGPLHDAGIGELELAPGVPTAELEQLVRHLAAIGAEDDPERTVQRLLDDRGLPHVRLRASRHDEQAGTDPWSDWSMLPLPAAPPPGLQAYVARCLATNLPALAAQQLLADAPASPEADGAVLVELLGRMLDERDLASASWLLAEVEPHTALPAAVRSAVREAALRRVDDAWLGQVLEHGSRAELMNLTSLVVQLGDDVAARFARLVADGSQPFSRWLGDLLRH